MIIKILDTLEDVLSFIEQQEYEADDYFKVEIFRTEAGQYRVGIITNRQYEMEV